MVGTQTRQDIQWDRDLLMLYERHYEALCAAARPIVGGTQAEELVQESFLRFHERQCHPQPGRELAYLRSMVLNSARSTLRRQGRLRSLPTPAICPEPIEEIWERKSAASEVRDAASTLKGRQAEVIALRYFEGLSESETAHRLGISTGSVKTHASRARTALRRELAS